MSQRCAQKPLCFPCPVRLHLPLTLLLCLILISATMSSNINPQPAFRGRARKGKNAYSGLSKAWMKIPRPKTVSALHPRPANKRGEGFRAMRHE